MLAQTPNTLYSSTSEMDDSQAEPPVYCHESNRRGRPAPFTFVSLNSFNSSWREEEGGCKTNERSEQRSSFFVPGTSQWAAAKREPMCREQMLKKHTSPCFWQWTQRCKWRVWGGWRGTNRHYIDKTHRGHWTRQWIAPGQLNPQADPSHVPVHSLPFTDFRQLLRVPHLWRGSTGEEQHHGVECIARVFGRTMV